MERKTNVIAEEGRQDLIIEREFAIPLGSLFRAYSEPELFGQWMGTKVLVFEAKRNGSYHFETSDPNGNVVFRAGGVFHEFSPLSKITRTFEMMEAPFGVQLEFLEFEAISENRSRLRIHSVFRSVQKRDALLQLPFAQGLNAAHKRLEEILTKTNF